MSQIQYGQYNVPNANDCVCLNVGQPSNEKLPSEEYFDAINELMIENAKSLFQYGKIEGYDNFRNDFANYLENKYKIYDQNITINMNNLIMTNGNTGGLQLLLSLFAEKNMTIFVEDPTYFLALDCFKDLDLNIQPIQMQSDGIDLNQLIDLLKKNYDQPNLTSMSTNSKKCILYTIPFFHNPTGICMSENKKNKLAEIANKYPNLIVISDEVYQFLSFQTNSTNSTNSTNYKLIPLCYYHNNFISLGSFSKVFCPAIRLGWITTFNNQIYNKISQCGQLDSSGNMNPISCAVMHKLILNGNLDHVMNKWKNFLKTNCDELSNCINNLLSHHIESIVVPTGGYFVWIKFKNYVDVVCLSNLMEKYKLKFHHGNKFSFSKTANNCMRLSFSWYSATNHVINDSDQLSNDYKLGIIRLKNLIEDNCSTNSIKINQIEPINNLICKVYVFGHTGKLGSLIVNHLNNLQSDSQLKYGGYIDRSFCFDKLLDDKSNYNVVIIDVSSSEATTNLLNELLRQKIYCPLIIGTTGNLPNNLILQYGNFAPVAISSNFSKGIGQFRKIINSFDPADKNEWKPTLTEIHHTEKKDAPSGTAKLIANYYGLNLIPFESIKSIREGKVFGEHHLTLEMDDETIMISHIAKSRELFAKGSINWIKWITNKSNGVYNQID